MNRREHEDEEREILREFGPPVDADADAEPFGSVCKTCDRVHGPAGCPVQKLAVAIREHVTACFDLTRNADYVITLGVDVPKPAQPVDLLLVAELINAEHPGYRASAPWFLKDGIEIETFEDEGSDMTWNMED